MSPDDYGGVSGQFIQFNTGDTNQTHTITITQDDICEVEFFLSTIVLVSDISLFEHQATVFIDDSMCTCYAIYRVTIMLVTEFLIPQNMLHYY